MARFRSETWVGVFVVAAVALLFWGTMQLSNLRGAKGYDLRAVFANVSGLEQSSPVRMVGVKIGAIKGIRIVPGGAEVAMEIDTRVPVPRDSVFSIRSSGILGDKYIEVEPGKSAEAYRVGEVVVNTRAGADLDKLLESLESAGTDLKEILASLRKVIASEKGSADLAAILENVRRLSGNLANLVDDNRKKVDSILAHLDSLTGRLDGIAADNREEIQQSIANIRDISARLKEDLPRLTGKLEGAAGEVQGVVADNREEIKRTIEQIHKDAAELEKTLASVNAVAKKIESGEGTIGKLVTDEKAYNELTSALEGVNKYIRKGDALKFYLDLHASYLTELEGTKGYLTVDIAPSPDKFYRLELLQDPQGNRIFERQVETVTPPGATVATETTKYKDQFKFSLEMGKRWHDTVLRIGFIESAFGVGMDTLFANDDLRLTADFWDFNRNEGPNSRLLASWKFLGNFHLDVGGEDFFNRDRNASFLIGLGLTFQDDDLKYILSSVPLKAN